MSQDAGIYAYGLFSDSVTNRTTARKPAIVDWGLTTAALMFVSLDAPPRLNVILGLDLNRRKSQIAHLTFAALSLFVFPS
jgi:hypothetical protein